MGGLVANLSKRSSDWTKPTVTEAMAKAASGRGKLDLIITSLGCLGVMRHDDESFLLRDKHISLAFHGYLCWSRRSPLALRSKNHQSESLVEAWHRYSSDCLKWLSGEYALVLVDETSGEVHGARQFCGTRPLHWSVQQNTLFLGSDPRQILAVTPGNSQLNAAVLDRYKRGHFPEPDDSLFDGIRRVVAGSACRFTLHRQPVSISRPEMLFKTPSIDRERSMQPDEALGQEILHAIANAVDQTVPCGYSAALMLSGGMDSTLLATSAFLGPLPALGERLVLVNVAFPGLACDESAQARRLASTLAARTDFVAFDESQFEQAAAWVLDKIDYPAMSTTHFLLAAARQCSSPPRTVLSGQGGDEWFTFAPNSLNAVTWRELFVSRKDLLQWLSMRLRRGSVRQGISLALRIGWTIARPAKSQKTNPRFDSMLLHLQTGTNQAALEQCCSHAGLDIRCPYFNTDLVELIGSVSPSRAFAVGKSKGLLWLAGQRRLPPRILDGTKKMLMTPARSELLGNRGPALARFSNQAKALALQASQANGHACAEEI